MNIRVVSGRTGLQTLESDWRRLASQSPHYFHDFDWYREYISVEYETESEIRFLIAEEGQRVVGILPIERRVERIRRIPTSIWAIVGSRLGDVLMLASSSDLLAESSESARKLVKGAVDVLKRTSPRTSLLLVGRVFGESSANTAIAKISGRRFSYVKGGVNWFDLDRPYAQLHEGLSANFRANLRKARKRADAAGAIRFSISRPSSTDFQLAFEQFKEIEGTGWKGRLPEGSALESGRNNKQLRFLESIYLNGRIGCEPFIARLMLQGECISALLGWRWKSTVAVPKIAYDEGFSRLSPGNLLVKELFEHFCADPDIRWADFMADAAWHAPWKPVFQAHHWSYFPLAPVRGNALVSLLKLSR